MFISTCSFLNCSVENMKTFTRLFFLFIIVYFADCRRCYSTKPRINERFCLDNGDKLYVGDFDGDTYDDILCFNKHSGKKIIKYSLSQPFGDPLWESNKRWCVAADDAIYLGDFNGDGKKDILCHHKLSGFKGINYATEQGEFAGTTDFYKDMRFCYHQHSTLHIGDFNLDGKDDMLCSDVHGNVWIAFANALGRFHGVNYYKKLTCAGESFIGDFNGDGRTDLLCFKDLLKQVYVFKKNGFDLQFDNSLQKRWCGSGQFLRIGDLNGDGYSDLLCHNKGNSHYWVLLNKKEMYFDEGRNDFDDSFCHVQRDRYLFGDFNGDGKDDMFCLNNGWYQVHQSNCQ